MPQPIDAEMFRIYCRAERIAVLKHEFLIALKRIACAIGHDGKTLCGAHFFGQQLRGLAALLGRAAFQPHDQHARQAALRDLIHQQLLLLAGVLRQKGAHIGREAAAGNHPYSRQQAQRPQQHCLVSPCKCHHRVSCLT